MLWFEHLERIHEGTRRVKQILESIENGRTNLDQIKDV